MSNTVDITILVPTPLRRFTDGQAKVGVTGETVADALDDLNARFPGIGERLLDDEGQIRRFVNIFVNGQNVRDANGAQTSLKSGDEVGIIPAMAGGRGR
jgi:molybdopterin synthase sulfur carrier subunit